MDYCYEAKGLPAGQHLFTIWPKNQKRITLSYVITWTEAEVSARPDITQYLNIIQH